MTTNKTLTDLVHALLEDPALSSADKLLQIATVLNRQNSKYTWVGFYFMNNTNQTLHLGPYVGKPTEHTVIPYGSGICGQVAVSGQTYLAEDVSQESNYIACSLDVRSEIVVPIYSKQELVAQLDIDSSYDSAFTPQDRKVLEEICEKIGEKMGSEMQALIE